MVPSMFMLMGMFSIILLNSEYDCRSTYCVLSICKLLNMLTPEIVKGVGDFLLRLIMIVLMMFRCQTYEGGFGGTPGSEAHGGYTFCAVAGLALLNRLHECKLPLLEVIESFVIHHRNGYMLARVH